MDKFVSIILPIRNEANFIIPCLRSIAAQDYPKDQMELLIVDGRSTDSTVQKIEEYRIQNSEFRIHLVDNPARTAPHAMNLGIAKARGDIILRFDGHAIMEPDYVTNCVKYLEQTKADNVGGPMRAVGNGTTGRAIALAHASPFGLGGGAFHSDFEGFADTAYLGCFPKETFAKYGLYDTRLTRNQDIELNARIRKGQYLNSEFRIQDSESGPGKIYLTPKIKSYYYCRNTIRGLWSQNFRNGQWVVYTKWIAPYALSLRHFVPLAFVTSLILLLLLVLISAPQGLTGSKVSNVFNLGVWSWHLLFLRLLALELLLYFTSMLVAVILAGRAQLYDGPSKEKPAQYAGDTIGIPSPGNCIPNGSQPYGHRSIHNVCSLALLPVVFMTLHFSYGLGSLWGMISLPFRRKGESKQ